MSIAAKEALYADADELLQSRKAKNLISKMAELENAVRSWLARRETIIVHPADPHAGTVARAFRAHRHLS
ncbi:MAG: hypothetical protein OXI60_05205 [Acidiferrobacterales bacterium]|nr:hypothetical protein [Acidiferrobacterales bacterium]